MDLILNGSSLPIAQLAPDFLMLQEPAEHPPANAEIVLRVDEREYRWAVHLPEGLRRDQECVPIAKRE